MEGKALNVRLKKLILFHRQWQGIAIISDLEVTLPKLYFFIIKSSFNVKRRDGWRKEINKAIGEGPGIRSS